MKKYLSLFIAFLFLLLPTYSSAMAVEELPCVQQVEITPRIAYAGSVVTIEAKVTHLVLDVILLQFDFYSPSGKEKKEVALTYDKQGGVFSGCFEVKSGDEKGVWRLDRVLFKYARDHNVYTSFMWLTPKNAPQSTLEFLKKTLRKYAFIPDPEQVYFCIKDGSLSDLQLYYAEDNRWGYINETGDMYMYIKPQYVFASDFFNGLALILTSDKKYGYIDKNGREVIKPQFDHAGDFSEGYAFVRKNNKYGYIDITGKAVIDFKYDDAGSFSGGMAYIKTGGKYGFIDKTGKVVIPPVFDAVRNLSEKAIAVKSNGKWGYIDSTGKTIIKPVFDNASDFSENMAAVQAGALWGFIDKSGTLTVPAKYDTASDFSEGLAAVSSNKKLGYIDRLGNTVIPLQYALPDISDISDFHGGLAAVKKMNGKWGFIDKHNVIRIEPQFDFILVPFVRGLALVLTDDKSGYINTRGQFVWSRDTN